MDLEIQIFERLKREVEELKRNFNLYLKKIKEIAKKYNLEVYLVGSRVKRNFLEGSDYDFVVFISDNKWRNWLKILTELKKAVNENSYIEFHVYKKSWKEILKIYYKKYKKIC